jgi:hypothetical protein
MTTPASLRLALVCLVALLMAGLATPSAHAQSELSNRLVYHQLPTSPIKYKLTSPILSGNGKWAAYADSNAYTDDPEARNYIYLFAIDSGQSTEIDMYQPLCRCEPEVDISTDGQTVLSTDEVQLRIAGASKRAPALLALASNEITVARLSGDSKTVVFIVNRDTTTADGKTALEKGVWTIPASGGKPRLLAGVKEVAAAGISAEAIKASPVFHLDGASDPLAVSADGSTVAFGAFAGGGDYVFTIAIGGGKARKIAGPFNWVRHTALNGDGTTVAYGTQDGEQRDVGIVVGNGKPKVLFDTSLETYHRLQLSADGKWLFLGSDATLVEVATLLPRPLGAGGNFAVPPQEMRLMESPGYVGLGLSTMSGDASRVLFPTRGPSLALLEIGADLGDAPLIKDVHVQPDRIPIDGSAAVTVEATVLWDGKLIGVGLVALFRGRVDTNVAGEFGLPLTDTQGVDAQRGQGVFTTNQLKYSAVEAREDDAGPRTIRIVVETETADGRRHATALDVGTLTVTAP